MSAALQAKVHLLAVLLAAFTLLTVPMFMQFREDTADAMPKAKDTALSKMFRDLSKQFKDQKLDPDEQIEDAWMQQAEEYSQNCQGSACTAEGDLDGDGKSNADELRDGTNPACDESQWGDDYCRNADRFNVTTPAEPPRIPLRKVLLFNRTFTYTQGQNTMSDFFQVREVYRTIEVYLNMTSFQGFSWQVRVAHADPGKDCTRSNNNAFLAGPSASDSCFIEAPPLGSYRVEVTTNVATAGTWHVMAYGVTNGS